jgi:hypothetical protein
LRLAEAPVIHANYDLTIKRDNKSPNWTTALRVFKFANQSASKTFERLMNAGAEQNNGPAQTRPPLLPYSYSVISFAALDNPSPAFIAAMRQRATYPAKHYTNPCSKSTHIIGK